MHSISGAIKTFYLFGHPIGELEAFRNYKRFSVLFPKILDAIERFTKVRIFLIPLSLTFLNPKILVFLFRRKLA